MLLIIYNVYACSALPSLDVTVKSTLDTFFVTLYDTFKTPFVDLSLPSLTTASSFAAVIVSMPFVTVLSALTRYVLDLKSAFSAVTPSKTTLFRATSESSTYLIIT